MRHAAAVLVQHMAVDDDALAQRLALVLDGEIVIVLAHGLVAVDRTGQLRQRVPHRDQRLLRRPLDGAAVARRQPRRMRGVAREGIDQCHAMSSGASPSSRAKRSDPSFVIPGWCASTRPGISRYRVRAGARPGMTGDCLVASLIAMTACAISSASRWPSRRPGRRRRTWWQAHACRRASPCHAPRSSPAARRSCRGGGRAQWRRHAG